MVRWGDAMKKILMIVSLILITIILMGFEEQVEIEFTAEELQWIQENPVIRVAPDINYGPIEYLDEDGKLKGASLDYLEWIEEHSGLEVELVIIDTWPEIIEAVKNREIDFLSAATKTEQREEYLLFTEPYIAVPNVIITRLEDQSNLVLDDLVGKEVVVLEDYAIQDYLEFYYSNIELFPVVTLDEGLSLVSFGTKDYMVVSIAQVSYYIKEKAINNLKVSGESGYNNELSMAVRDDWPMLRRILNKAIKAMPEKEQEKIFNRWVNIEVDQVLSQEMVYAVLIVLAISLIILTSILYFNHALRIRVDERTELYKNELSERHKAEAELADLNDTLEEKVKERTEALSKAIEDLKSVQEKLIETEKLASLGRVIMGVSHQLNTPIGASISLTSFLQKKQKGLFSELEKGALNKEGLINYLEEINHATDLMEKELDLAKTFIEHFKELTANTYPQEMKKINLSKYLSNLIGIYGKQLEAQNVIVKVSCDKEINAYTSLVYLNNIFRNLVSNSLTHGFINTTDGHIYIEVALVEDEIVIKYKDDGVGIERDILNSVYEPLFTTSMGTSSGLGLNILYNTVITSMNGSLDLSSDVGFGVNFTIRFRTENF